MIRFCDREVGCVEYDSLNRGELLSYFLSGHVDDIIIVYDSFDTMRYMGNITYYALLFAININSAIQEEYLILNQDIWRNARDYFARINKLDGKVRLIPVVNEEQHLICFAYEDEEANREIRMLRELSECSEALQFADIYPDYKCVKIYEFNELAYFFAKYLESQSIPVQVHGAMWQKFFTEEECIGPDYTCMTIYAEGIAEKKQNLLENALRSVSVEFECVDQIYEANIKNGIFRNAEGNWEELAERLRGENEIVIIGTDIEAQKTYGFLAKNNIDVCCFVGIGSHCDRMFGKKILDYPEIRGAYKCPLYIECESKGSAWGIGNVDNYDYMGYERNKRFILLRDYVEVPEDSVIDALRNRKTYLLGDKFLCQRLTEYLLENSIPVLGCLGMLPQDDVFEEVSDQEIDYVETNTTWLIVKPEVWNGDVTWAKEQKQVISFLREKKIDDYTDYFCRMKTYINVEKRSISLPKQVKPKKIVLGAIDDHSGNVFFRGLLDNHPSVLMIADYGSFNDNLFWICVSLSMVNVQDILSCFWGIYEAIGTAAINNKELFNEKMEKLLEGRDRVTSQQLFVLFHIAYMCMEGKEAIEADINNMIIYWEPHDMPRESVADYVKWMGGGISCGIINVVRNSCMQIGSRVKMRFFKGMSPSRSDMLTPYGFDEKEYENVKRMAVRFEDLKCEPRKTLLDVCNWMNIPWSESLMEVSRHGQKYVWFNAERMVSDFDLEPVYNTYEKYLSEFDRLRIMIFNGPKQKKYGYPYIELKQFSRRELQEMFLMDYRIEKLVGSYKIDEMSVIIQKRIRGWLQVLRMYEVMTESMDMKLAD